MRPVIFLTLILALGYVATRVLFLRRRILQGRNQDRHAQASTAVTHELVQDPNCHTYFPRSQAIRRKIRGNEHFFCSTGCLNKFLDSHS